MAVTTGAKPGSKASAADKKLLAFDALSRLTEQFALDQDLDLLVESLMLTVAGQFGVGSAYVSVNGPSPSCKLRFFAVGKFRDNPLLASSSGLLNEAKFPFRQAEPARIGDLHHVCTSPRLIADLREAGVALVAPLCLGKSIIGVIGLSPKLNQRPFDDNEMAYLGTFANSIAPLINNSLLYLNIKSLNEWHVNLIDTISQGIYVFDSRRTLIKLNSAAINILKQVTGRDREETLLHGLKIDDVFPDSTFPGWARRFHKLSSAASTRNFEKLAAKSERTERVFNARVTILPEERRDETDLIITLDDITAQTASENRLFEVEKFAERGIMASSIAHELNNFLAMILGGVQLAQHALRAEHTENLASALVKLEQNVGRMERFTAGLMDLARLRTQKTECNLNTILSDALSFVRVQKKFTHLSVQTDLDHSLPEINADEDQVSQLVLNLFNNAADAIQEAQREQGVINVQTYVDDHHVCLSIRDNGRGIDPAVKDRLFSERLSTKDTGHGFGLVTCAKIIKNHDGTVEVDSTPAVGSTFTVRFPLKTEQLDSKPCLASLC